MHEIIDFHTHPFLRGETNLCMYQKALSLDADTTLRDMDAAGITRFCGSVIEPNLNNGFETIKACNREALRLREHYGERYIPGFHVHPDFIEESLTELELAEREGVRMVGELVPYMHGWEDYSCEGFSKLLDAIEEKNMLVNLHTMNLAQMQSMAKNHPNVTFVFAHPGDRDRVPLHVGVMQECPNVHLDLSGTGIFRYGVIRHLINEVGAERLLFGTDYPICNLPMYVNAVLGEPLSDTERALIFSGNAKRLLSL